MSHFYQKIAQKPVKTTTICNTSSVGRVRPISTSTATHVDLSSQQSPNHSQPNQHRYPHQQHHHNSKPQTHYRHQPEEQLEIVDNQQLQLRQQPRNCNMPYSQTHSPNSWMVNVETPNNGPLLLSPPHNQPLMQRDNMQVTQPSSPLASPSAFSTAMTDSPFGMPSRNVSAVVANEADNISPNTTKTTVSGNTSAMTSSVIEAVGSLTLSTSMSSSSLGGSASANNIVQQQYQFHNAAADDTVDPKWQATKATVRERNAAMFNNDLMADITFVVGGSTVPEEHVQTIPAHKYVLATGSSVFFAMFFGGLADDKQTEIHVPDVEPMAFLTLLKYLYCDEIQLEADNVLATLYASKKYIVPHLARACVNYLETSLTAKNACLLLSQSRLFEEPELMQRCWEVIDAQAEMAIKSDGFVDIDLNTFESILGRETLNCKEINLFEAALCWAQAACQKIDIDSTSANRRHVLGKALQLIRIPTMTLEEFANGVAQLGILTADETIAIFLNFTATVKPVLGFNTRPRTGLKTQVCHRFQSCAYRSNQWRYRGRCDSIQFSADKRIFIVGFGLYGSSTGAADYNVKIELKRLGRVLSDNSTHFYSDGSSNTFHVFFQDPIQVEPDLFYTASVVLDGTELSFFGQEGMTEVCMGNVTFQFQCSSESTNGTGVQGGQIPELIFYGPTRSVMSGSGGAVEMGAAMASTSLVTQNSSTSSSVIGADAYADTVSAVKGNSVGSMRNGAHNNGGNNNQGD